MGEKQKCKILEICLILISNWFLNMVAQTEILHVRQKT